MKKALAISGDGYHAVTPLHLTIVKELQNREYDVPLNKSSDFNLIVISRYAFDDVQRFSQPDLPSNNDRWLTRKQEEQFSEYVKDGGNILIYHGGFAFYRKDGSLSKLAKSHFINHPPISSIKIKPINGFDELAKALSLMKFLMKNIKLRWMKQKQMSF